MNIDVVRRLKAHLGSEDGTEPAEESVTDGGPNSRLFTCRDCDYTYIAMEMDSCPECGEELQVVPNEKDLGLV